MTRPMLPEPVTAQEIYLADIAASLRLLVAAKQATVVQENVLGTLMELTPMEANPLPNDFPGRDALLAAGIRFVEDVPRTVAELTPIAGIGLVTAQKILEALEALGE